jgi:hypothetical protein
MLRNHEKFIAFCLLGGALVGLAVMVYLKPPSSAVLENGAGMAMLNTIVGALTLAFGGSANALFKITSSERAEIGQAAADAITGGEPVKTEVVNKPSDPVQTHDASAAHSDGAGLPEALR